MLSRACPGLGTHCSSPSSPANEPADASLALGRSRPVGSRRLPCAGVPRGSTGCGTRGSASLAGDGRVETAQSWYLLVHHEMVVHASAGRLHLPSPSRTGPGSAGHPQTLATHPVFIRARFSLLPAPSPFPITVPTLGVQPHPPCLPLVANTAVLPAARVRGSLQRSPPASLHRDPSSLTSQRPLWPRVAPTLSHTTQGRDEETRLAEVVTPGVCGGQRRVICKGLQSRSPGSPALWRRTP